MKVTAKYDLALNAPQNNITLLARNQAYRHFTSGVCGKPAIYVCDECAYERKPFIARFVTAMEKYDGRRLFVVICNPPRMGV
ncbi:MAG: hypothetical protein IPN94_26510 [Sphingobacteriales bacterium]|nr:hypothetical protein [Sphingobacteriales bacterium]